MRLKRDHFLTSNISDKWAFFNIQTWHSGRLHDAIYVHDRFQDLELDARSSGSQKANNQRCMLLATKEAINIKLATTVGHFDVTLFLQRFIWILFICTLLTRSVPSTTAFLSQILQLSPTVFRFDWK